MGIKLDWEIESEQTQARAAEDPEARRRRHIARRRLLLPILGLAVALLAASGAVFWRLDQVDNQYRQDLLDTVQIETAALRIGDFAGFMAVQRSASDAFMLDQSRAFEEYQQIKQTHQVELPGTVVDATIDHLRGRVVVARSDRRCSLRCGVVLPVLRGPGIEGTGRLAARARRSHVFGATRRN